MASSSARAIDMGGIVSDTKIDPEDGIFDIQLNMPVA